MSYGEGWWAAQERERLGCIPGLACVVHGEEQQGNSSFTFKVGSIAVLRPSQAVLGLPYTPCFKDMSFSWSLKSVLLAQVGAFYRQCYSSATWVLCVHLITALHAPSGK